MTAILIMYVLLNKLSPVKLPDRQSALVFSYWKELERLSFSFPRLSKFCTLWGLNKGPPEDQGADFSVKTNSIPARHDHC